MSAPPPPSAPLAELAGVAVRYPHARRDAVGPVSLSLAPGERVLLLGPSGSGKSTLLHCLTGIVPHSQPADLRGSVRLFGAAVDSRPPHGWAADAAYLFQDAEDTLCGFTVEDEIAFAPENQRLPPAGIAARVAGAMARAGLPEAWRGRRVSTLSGGEKQLVALAALLAQGARLVVADEPTASLAPLAAGAMASLLLGEARPEGVLVVDHRLGPILSRIDRVAVLGHEGRLIAEGPPPALFAEHGARLAAKGIWTPLATSLAALLCDEAGAALPPLLEVAALRAALDGLAPPARKRAAGLLRSRLVQPEMPPSAPPLVRLEGAACAPPFGPVVLRDVTLSLAPGEVLGIIGPNGAGKSTLAAALAGLARPAGGLRHGPPGALAFQNPEAHFAQGSVLEELTSLGQSEGAARATLAEWGLAGLEGQHAYTLSAGQKRRLALATLTATDRWPLLVLDEPSAGLDAAGAGAIAGQIARLAAGGRAIALISHDMDLVLASCHRVALVAGGTIRASGPAATLLRDRALLEGAGLALPEAAPLLDWAEAA